MVNRKWLFIVFGAIFFLTGLTGFFMFKLVEEDVESVQESAETQPEVPPKTATEILAAELAGEPDAFPKATADDLKRPPAQNRTEISLEEEFDNMAGPREDKPEVPENETEDEDQKIQDKPKKREIASVPKKTEAFFKIESSKTKLSKNLDRKKALAQLRKDFGKDNCKASGKNKKLEAIVELKKDGQISKVRLQPSAPAEKDLVSCLKKKLTSKAKAYQSKDKSGGKLTLQIKIK